MPTLTDPAVWLPTLFDNFWEVALESLRSSGSQLTVTRPNIKPTGLPSATQSVKNALSTKIFQLTDESLSRVTHGDRDEDAKVDWAIQFVAGGEYERARMSVRQASEIAHRLLLLFRSNPHPEWHRIENVRIVHDIDYADYQRRTVQFTLHRYGEATPNAIQTVTT